MKAWVARGEVLVHMVVQHMVFDFLDSHQIRERSTKLNGSRGDFKMPPKIIKTVLATKNDFVLFTEDNRMFVNPTLEAIQEVLDSLDTGFGNSFAILSRGENYVQTLHGLNGFHIELRETLESSFVHYRVGRISDSSEPVEPSELKKSDGMTSQGFSNELLKSQDVILVFSGFLHDETRSGAFLWRVIDFESDTLEA